MEDMPTIFQRNIHIFLSSIPTLKKRMVYLQKLNRGDDWVRQLIVRRPKIIICHMQRQVGRIRGSLKKVGMHPTDDEIIDLIIQHSPLYQMSSRKIDEGLAFLTQELGLSPEIFMEFPQAVGYSLEKRTRPRVKIVQSLGLVIADRGQPGLSLAQILVTTFPTFKYCIESGAWLRKYGGHVKQLEYDDTGAVLAGLAEAEAEDLDGEGDLEIEVDLPGMTGETESDK
jgi:hypothetical protein